MERLPELPPDLPLAAEREFAAAGVLPPDIAGPLPSADVPRQNMIRAVRLTVR